MAKAKTTIKYRGIEYPFYKTTRGEWDFENAGFSKQGVANGNTRDLVAITYFQMKDCAKRAGSPIDDTLENFVDNIELDIVAVWSKLKEEEKKINPPLEKKEIVDHEEGSAGKQKPEVPADH